jgi:hypothetical protein
LFVHPTVDLDLSVADGEDPQVRDLRFLLLSRGHPSNHREDEDEKEDT